MAHTEVKLKDLEKDNLVSLVLSLKSEHSKFIDTLRQRIDNLSSNLAQFESSLVVTKQLITN